MTNRKDVFVIQKNGGKSYWKKCGVAFANQDGSVNVKLDLFPGVDLQIGVDPNDLACGFSE
jgi:hypothetical protein